MRNSRNFFERAEEERRWLQDNTWCDACGEADLGMSSPTEYEEAGVIFVEGACRRCGQIVRSEVTTKDAG